MKNKSTNNATQPDFPYTLLRKNVKNINLRVRADGSVTISAGHHVPLEHIQKFALSKEDYILKSLSQFKSLEIEKTGEKEYVSGENVSILGRDLRLKIVLGEENSVFADGVFLYVTIKNPEDKHNKSKTEKMVNHYLNTERKREFLSMTIDIHKKIEKYGVAMPEIRIREMKTRWGSCLPQKGVITLNTHLFAMPRPCIQYVILHELCHFIHPNHSKDFYDFLTMFMPDWRAQKEILESLGKRV